MRDFYYEWRPVIVPLAFILLMITGMIWAVVPNTQREKAEVVAGRVCADRGYQGWANKYDILYCETYGLEPSIVRLGTVQELAPDF